MSLNLKDYEKVKADEKFSVLRHKNGSEMKIAHAGLSPDQARRIHAMPMFAWGGLSAPTSLGSLAGDAAQTSADVVTGGLAANTNIGGQVSNAVNNPSSIGQTMGVGQNNPGATYSPGLAQVASTQGVNDATANALGAQQQLGGLATQTGAGVGAGMQNQAMGAAGLRSNAGQLQGIANGTGPNPAQAMLNQQTAQNVGNQAALMASQRGAGANPALLARQAAQQGAATQQQAVGQGATLQSQQQLGALNQLQGVNSALAGVGSSQVNQGVGATTSATQGAQNEQNIQTGALGNQNATLTNAQNNINTVNGVLNNTGLQGQQQLAGGLWGGFGTGLNALASAAARGGEVKAYEGGGQVDPGAAQTPASAAVPQIDTGTAQTPAAPDPTQPQSSFFGFLKNWASGSNNQQTQPDPGAAQMNPGAASLNKAGKGIGTGLVGLAALAAARGGKVKGLVSEGEVVVPPKDASNPKAAAKDVSAAMKNGGTIKAKSADEKAVKSGNSYANDKIEKDLPVGGVVIPRSVMQSKDPVSAAAKFVKDVMAKKGKK